MGRRQLARGRDHIGGHPLAIEVRRAVANRLREVAGRIDARDRRGGIGAGGAQQRGRQPPPNT